MRRLFFFSCVTGLVTMMALPLACSTSSSGDPAPGADASTDGARSDGGDSDGKAPTGSAGELDLSFGNPTSKIRGMTLLEMLGSSYLGHHLFVRALRRAPDGDLLLALDVVVEQQPYRGSSAIVRLSPDGVPRGAFGTDGVRTFDDDAYGKTVDLVVDSGGNIILVGDALDYSSAPAGSVSGYRLVSFDGRGQPLGMKGPFGTAPTYFYAQRAFVRDDGKITITGHVPPEGAAAGLAFALHDAAGNLDMAFGTGGIKKATTSAVDGNYASLRADRSILVADRQSLYLFDSNGEPRTSFGQNGILQPSALSIGASPQATLAEGDHVAGCWRDSEPDAGLVLIGRYTPSGAPSAGFGDAGLTIIRGPRSATRHCHALESAPDNRLFIAGAIGEYNTLAWMTEVTAAGAIHAPFEEGSSGPSGLTARSAASGSGAAAYGIELSLREGQGRVIVVGTERKSSYLYMARVFL